MSEDVACNWDLSSFCKDQDVMVNKLIEQDEWQADEYDDETGLGQIAGDSRK